jgi:galactose oxidase-like protein/Kelch motif protein
MRSIPNPRGVPATWRGSCSIALALAAAIGGCAEAPQSTGPQNLPVIEEHGFVIKPVPVEPPSKGIPVVRTVELYDPSSGRFEPGGRMAEGRAFHTATLLVDGPRADQVLILGGVSSGGSTSIAGELYDPHSGEFHDAGANHSVDRADHAAAAIDGGKVLIVGGITREARRTETYDRATGEFAISYTVTRRNPPAATPLEPLPAGVAAWGTILNSAELYEPASGSLSRTAAMRQGRAAPTITTLKDGRVLVAGGIDARGRSLATAEIFDPSTERFSPVGAMTDGCAGATATLLNNGKVLIAGGIGGNGHVLDTAELYNPSSRKFARIRRMTSRRVSATATLLTGGDLAGQVLIAGGFGELGDSGQEALSSVELYNPRTGRFVAISDMTSPRADHVATALGSGGVLITGGLERAGSVLATAEIFDPATSRFVAIGSMAERRIGHTATVLADGRVLIAGGASGPASGR